MTNIDQDVYYLLHIYQYESQVRLLKGMLIIACVSQADNFASSAVDVPKRAASISSAHLSDRLRSRELKLFEQLIKYKSKDKALKLLFILMTID